MTTATLTREDTGELSPVRFIDYPGPMTWMDQWDGIERDAHDELTAWTEGQAAQALAEMRNLCDELGAPPVFADLPPDPAAELAPERLDAEAEARLNQQIREGLTEQARRFVPNPDNYGPHRLAGQAQPDTDVAPQLGEDQPPLRRRAWGAAMSALAWLAAERRQP